MKVHFCTGDLDQIKNRCLVAFATQDGAVLNGTPAVREILAPFAESGEFGKGFGGHIYVANPSGLAVDRLLVFNLGEKVSKVNDLRKGSAAAWKLLRTRKLTEVLLSLEGLNSDERRAAVEGFFLGDYQFNQYKSEKDQLPSSLEELSLHGAQGDEAQIERWQAICRGTNRARDLNQLPANVLNPVKLAEFAAEWGESQGVKVSWLNRAEMEKLGMGCLLSVAQGSANEPRLIQMEYEPAQPSGKTFVLVGKAVTFDSGGLNLKPGESMLEMKGDMGGGAVVIATMSVLRETGCPHRVIGLVPSVENMPSGTAFRPSDIFTSYSGVTVEVKNTDAEGRLILADALSYAKNFNPDYVIDFATLTGAVMVALGPKIMGVMGNHQPLVDAVLKAGEQVHEIFWQLPLFDEYNALIKSELADISNLASTRWGGAITAGLFLQRFAKDYKWAHCDIASALYEKADEVHPSGGTGMGVRTAVEVLAQF